MSSAHSKLSNSSISSLWAPVSPTAGGSGRLGLECCWRLHRYRGCRYGYIAGLPTTALSPLARVNALREGVHGPPFLQLLVLVLLLLLVLLYGRLQRPGAVAAGGQRQEGRLHGAYAPLPTTTAASNRQGGRRLHHGVPPAAVDSGGQLLGRLDDGGRGGLVRVLPFLFLPGRLPRAEGLR